MRRRVMIGKGAFGASIKTGKAAERAHVGSAALLACFMF